MSSTFKHVVVYRLLKSFTSYITYACKYTLSLIPTYTVHTTQLHTPKSLIHKGFCCALTTINPFVILVNIMHLIGVYTHRIDYINIALLHVQY